MEAQAQSEASPVGDGVGIFQEQESTTSAGDAPAAEIVTLGVRAGEVKSADAEQQAPPSSQAAHDASSDAGSTTAPEPVKRKRKSRAAPIEIDPAAAASLVPKLEAVLISCDRPMHAVRLGQLLGLLPMDAEGEAPADATRVEQASALIAQVVRTLNQQLEASARSFRVELLSGGYRVMTLSEHADVVAGLHKVRQQTKLSRAAVESLAVIAYRQPMTRAELESIRGVSCGEVLRTLVERRLVTVKGRAEELGRPLIYGTTPQFLEHFGLASIKDLPSAAEGLTG